MILIEKAQVYDMDTEQPTRLFAGDILENSIREITITEVTPHVEETYLYGKLTTGRFFVWSAGKCFTPACGCGWNNVLIANKLSTLRESAWRF